MYPHTLFGYSIFTLEGIKSVCSIGMAVVGQNGGTAAGDTLVLSTLYLIDIYKHLTPRVSAIIY